MKQADEFKFEGGTYKTTKVLKDNKFFGIYVGLGITRDTVTYNGFMKRGDFKLDNVLFKQRDNKIILLKEASGVLGLLK